MRLAPNAAPFEVETTEREIVIRVRAPDVGLDALIPIESKELAKYGLEEKPVRRLAEAGTLRAVTIGRRRFTTMRHLCALVDALPPARVSGDQDDDVSEAAAKRARRRGS